MAEKSRLQEMIDRYDADHQHPVNRATHMVGIPMIIISLPLLLAMPPLGLALFIIGWVLQFIGHAFEGKAPTFFSDPRFLGVGALYFMDKWRSAFGKVDPAT